MQNNNTNYNAAGAHNVQKPLPYPQQPMGYPQQPMEYPRQDIAMTQRTRTGVQRGTVRSGVPQTTNGYYFSFGETEADAQIKAAQQQAIMERTAAAIAAAVAASSGETKREEQKNDAPKSAPEKIKKKKAARKSGVQKNARAVSQGRLIRDRVILAGMLLLFSLCATVLLSSGIKQSERPFEQRDFLEDLNAELVKLKSDSVSAIYNLPRVYTLPWGEQPAPVPNPDGYGKSVNENGDKTTTYSDETISVTYWNEHLCYSTVHFADITIAHPTQLRTAYAGGVFGASTKYTPQTIARQVNAVIAVNGDFCGYRAGGIIFRQNTLYRNNPSGWDVLLIDSRGDFHIMRDYDVETSGVLEEYDIVNSLEFGPSLVIDGEINYKNIGSGCGPKWNEVHASPRTAVGQIGELHYLFCCVEGRKVGNIGVVISQLAQIMYDKGCVQAYALDGGQSTTMIMGGKAMNDPLWGGQRVVTDILYCATAIPDDETGGANE